MRHDVAPTRSGDRTVFQCRSTTTFVGVERPVTVMVRCADESLCTNRYVPDDGMSFCTPVIENTAFITRYELMVLGSSVTSSASTTPSVVTSVHTTDVLLEPHPTRMLPLPSSCTLPIVGA